MLAHHENSAAGKNNWDMISNNKFRVTFVPPASMINEPLVTEHVMSVSGFVHKGPEVTTQQYLQATRAFAQDAPADTTQQITFGFTLNRNNSNQNYVWNYIRDWRKIVYNEETGEVSLKKDYIGTIVVECLDRNLNVMWTKTMHNSFPFGDSSGLWDADITDLEPKTIEQVFSTDYVTTEEL